MSDQLSPKEVKKLLKMKKAEARRKVQIEKEPKAFISYDFENTERFDPMELIAAEGNVCHCPIDAERERSTRHILSPVWR